MKMRFLILSLLVMVHIGHAQGFINLDFEDATIAPTPAGGYTFPADPAQCFPGWTVGGGGGGYPLVVMYNTLSLGAPAVILMGPDFPNSAGFTPLQGSYSTELYWFNGGNILPPTLSQTGFIPSDAKSISFLVGNSGSDAAVTINGVSISLVPVIGGRLAGDISVFAGSLATLAFSVAPNRTGDNGVYFDDIQFSSTSVPEPGVLAFGALGALLLGFSRWQNSNPAG
jgi:hypothetical protein